MKTDRIERIVEYSVLGLLVAGLGVISVMNYHPANKKILDDYLYGKSSSDSVAIGSADESSFGENSPADKPNDTADNHTPGIISEPAPSSKTETPADTPQTGLININTANLDQLQQLDGIGKVKAQAIIDYRESHGAFRTVDELTKVSGIGEKTLEKNRDRITV